MTDTEEEFDYCKLKLACKTAWLEGLRGGKYKQGRGHLRQSNGEDVYCCLGVLQDIIQPEDWIEPHGEEREDGMRPWSVPEGFDNQDDYGNPYLNDGEIQERLMDETNFDQDAMQQLIKLNDGERPGGDASKPRVGMKSFAEIADWIEEHL